MGGTLGRKVGWGRDGEGGGSLRPTEGATKAALHMAVREPCSLPGPPRAQTRGERGSILNRRQSDFMATEASIITNWEGYIMHLSRCARANVF